MTTTPMDTSSHVLIINLTSYAARVIIVDGICYVDKRVTQPEVTDHTSITHWNDGNTPKYTDNAT